ncbi:antibiotic biosynthesis monooxygenase family protein [Streptomyces sp. NBC_01803]|uniref:antibiotic biosynthesis monooxygenase family protein n=1 Tax=Streptomyces sp. NBC_01803 TaxID=2975946 RepID=UPI002DDB95FE|nr:antibiotic biosynthesis monooxygenase family protein [Streptomyces sp. NBC_01803]WSA47015.1 antibiotic biosynthesis monooxygenase [Streptomyces sp. NBC_01803]
MQLESLDPSTPLPAQLQEKTGPIVLVNTFVVPEGKMDEMIAVFQADAAFLRTRPGFLSAQLHRGTAGSNLLLNVAVWESTEALAGAFNDPEFHRGAHRFPEGVRVLPHVYERIAVPGVCVA